MSAPTPTENSLEAAYAFCQRMAESHYENFPVGSLLIPKRLRKHVYSIYAFARVADDFADEGYEDDSINLSGWQHSMIGSKNLNAALLAKPISRFSSLWLRQSAN